MQKLSLLLPVFLTAMGCGKAQDEAFVFGAGAKSDNGDGYGTILAERVKLATMTGSSYTSRVPVLAIDQRNGDSTIEATLVRVVPRAGTRVVMRVDSSDAIDCEGEGLSDEERRSPAARAEMRFAVVYAESGTHAFHTLDFDGTGVSNLFKPSGKLPFSTASYSSGCSEKSRAFRSITSDPGTNSTTVEVGLACPYSAELLELKAEGLPLEAEVAQKNYDIYLVAIPVHNGKNQMVFPDLSYGYTLTMTCNGGPCDQQGS